MTSTSERKSKEVRREEILDAAMVEFAEKGLDGASTEAIAKRAGISQPYIFRLFGTKRDLFMAVEVRCFRQTLEIFQRAAEGLRGEAALLAMGQAYKQLLADNPMYLLGQMQAYAACGDPAIRAVVRNGFGDLVAYVERVSGLDPTSIANFFARGMLMNVIASMHLGTGATEPWAERLVEGSKSEG
jgi:AcrR family transcriptional regulator